MGTLTLPVGTLTLLVGIITLPLGFITLLLGTLTLTLGTLTQPLGTLTLTLGTLALTLGTLTLTLGTLALTLGIPVIVGLATYFIQKRIDKRFNRIEEFQKTLITIRKERYDNLLKTVQEIWGKLVETEYYIRFDLVEQVKKIQQTKSEVLIFDSKPLKDALIFIEKRSIILENNLSDKTRNLFIKYLHSTYNGYIDIIRQAQAKQKSLTEVNEFIPNSLGDTYKKDLNELRKEFEKQAREILYEDK